MKKILVFILLQLILVCLLFGILSAYYDSLASLPLTKSTIKITGENPRDSSLTLDPPADHEVIVGPGSKVKWEIASSSKVTSFRIVKKDTSEDIFHILNHPPRDHERDAGGRVKFGAEEGDKYNYSIFWRMKGDSEEVEREFDPKLAVHSTFAPWKRWIYIAYAVLALSLSTVFFIRKKKH